MKVLRSLPAATSIAAALTLLAFGPFGNIDNAAAQSPIIVGIDMDPTGNTCPGDGVNDCTIGTIEKCVSVPNVAGQTFTIDTFIMGLTSGFRTWNHNLNFPDTLSPAKLTLTAETVTSAALNLSVQSSGSIGISLSEDVPDPPGSWPSEHGVYHASVGEWGTSETTPPFTQGVLGRYTFTVGSGATSGIYGLTLDQPASAYLNKNGAQYIIDQTWDFNFSPQYGIVALGAPCWAYANEDELRNTTCTGCRSTFVLDPGIGHYISRDFLLEYYETVFKDEGWSKNFLWYAYGPDSPPYLAGQSIIQVPGGDRRNWSYCLPYSQRGEEDLNDDGIGDACQTASIQRAWPICILFRCPVTLNVFAYDDPHDDNGPAFISRVCGNESENRTKPIPEISGTKFLDLDRDGEKDRGEGELQGWTIILRRSDGGEAARTLTGSDGSYRFLLDGLGPDTYGVEELPKAGWTQSRRPGPVQVDPGIGDKKFPGNDFGNYPTTLIVIKHVVNDDGGTAVAGDFNMTVTGNSPDPASFAGAEAPGVTVYLDAGSYSVTETGPSGYAASYSGDCGGSISAGDSKTCTVTNDDGILAGHIIIDKVTEPSGSPQSFDFTLTGGPSGLNQAFSLTDTAPPHDSGPVLPGSGYAAVETVPLGWTLTSATCDDGSPPGNIEVGPGETVTCTFANASRPVGGIFELQGGPTATAHLSDTAGYPYDVLGGVAAAVLLALTAGAWYARRLWGR